MSYYPPSPQFAAPSGPVRPSRVLRAAAIVLLWLTTAASAAVTVAAFSRRGVWQDYRNGASLDGDDLSDADAPVIIAAFVLTMLVVTSAIVIALWTLRLVNSAQAKRVPGLSPGWAVGGWFVPIGLLFLGFRQVTKAVAGAGGSTARVLRWQVSFAAVTVVMVIAQTTSEDISSLADPDETVSVLTRECILSLASSVLFIVSAALGTLALIHADRSADRLQDSA